MKNIQQLDEVVRPAGGTRACSPGVFQRQVPANDPGQQLAQRRVGVSVGAPRQRDHGGKFGVAKPSESTTKAREHENARPDDGPDAERGELYRSQSSLKTVLTCFFRLGEQHAHRLFRKQGVAHATSPLELSENAAPETTTQFGPSHCRGAACCAPIGKFNYFACSAWPVRRDHSQYTGS